MKWKTGWQLGSPLRTAEVQRLRAPLEHRADAAEHVAVLLAEDAAAEPLAAVLGRQRRLERLPHSSRPAEPRAAGAGL